MSKDTDKVGAVDELHDYNDNIGGFRMSKQYLYYMARMPVHREFSIATAKMLYDPFSYRWL